MIQEKNQVLWNKKVGPGYFKIGLNCKGEYSEAKPGQFVMLRLCGGIEPLLRRPFSIHRLISGNGQFQGIEILYKVVGKFTQKLSVLKKNESIDILGPLGSGFSIPKNIKRIFMIAGGMGVAPIVFLASQLKNNEVNISQCRMFLGGRSKDDILCLDDFDKLKMAVQLTTDDGSAGSKCLVTHPLEIALAERRPDVLYACGPQEMLKSVVVLAQQFAVKCQVSVETMMACGMGACLGCAVEPGEASGKYLHACLDGPVFDANAIKL
ncbi:MAG: dihydroorotate dehydrogenase electron transfer subunit [Thermodesulfobacteriota bacterium]|nr:dihydroorotate dehydrogenase electron transfer subunit [Thermodesulfobacteriota bacterium]